MQPFLSVSSVYDSPCMTWTVYWTLNLCRLPTLIRSALFTGYPECLPPAPILSLNSDSDSALPTLGLKLVFEFWLSDRFLFVIKLLLDLTTLPLHYRRLRHLRSSGFISATQPNHGLHRTTPTSSPGRPVYYGVRSPVWWAVLSGTSVWRGFVQGLVSLRTQWAYQIPSQILFSWRRV